MLKDLKALVAHGQNYLTYVTTNAEKVNKEAQGVKGLSLADLASLPVKMDNLTSFAAQVQTNGKHLEDVLNKMKDKLDSAPESALSPDEAINHLRTIASVLHVAQAAGLTLDPKLEAATQAATEAVVAGTDVATAELVKMACYYCGTAFSPSDGEGWVDDGGKQYCMISHLSAHHGTDYMATVPDVPQAAEWAGYQMGAQAEEIMDEVASDAGWLAAVKYYEETDFELKKAVSLAASKTTVKCAYGGCKIEFDLASGKGWTKAGSKRHYCTIGHMCDAGYSKALARVPVVEAAGKWSGKDMSKYAFRIRETVGTDAGWLEGVRHYYETGFQPVVTTDVEAEAPTHPATCTVCKNEVDLEYGGFVYGTTLSSGKYTYNYCSAKCALQSLKGHNKARIPGVKNASVWGNKVPEITMDQMVAAIGPEGGWPEYIKYGWNPSFVPPKKPKAAEVVKSCIVCLMSVNHSLGYGWIDDTGRSYCTLKHLMDSNSPDYKPRVPDVEEAKAWRKQLAQRSCGALMSGEYGDMTNWAGYVKKFHDASLKSPALGNDVPPTVDLGSLTDKGMKVDMVEKAYPSKKLKVKATMPGAQPKSMDGKKSLCANSGGCYKALEFAKGCGFIDDDGLGYCSLKCLIEKKGSNYTPTIPKTKSAMAVEGVDLRGTYCKAEADALRTQGINNWAGYVRRYINHGFMTAAEKKGHHWYG